MDDAVRPARAKVNLWLNVVGRRSDGYHLLHSLIAFCDLADTLEAEPSDRLTLVVDGPTAGGLAAEPDNLVLRAARMLADRAGVAPHAALRLTKNIPVAAGLGGGSADAAAALGALAGLWRVTVPVVELFDIAGALGADVPMCLAGRTAIASGIGERLEPAPPLPACAVLLVNPGTSLPTLAVFKARRGDFSPECPVRQAWPDLATLAAALAERGNDLAEAAVSLRPEIGDVLRSLRKTPGVRYAAMSGSGATCFALYDDPSAATQAAESLPVAWWRHVGRFV